jgi:hypothetical protein
LFLPEFCNEKRTATKTAFKIAAFTNLAEKHKVTHLVDLSKTIKLYKPAFVAVPFSLLVILGAKFRFYPLGPILLYSLVGLRRRFVCQIQRIMKKVIPIIVCIFLCVHVPTTAAQPASHHEGTEARAGRPFIRNYNPKEYGAAFNYWAIAQDRRGVMYFGNWNGVLEYDGVSWRLISTPNKSGVRSLAIDEGDPQSPSSGRIYVGAVGDLGYLAPDAIGDMQFVSLLDHVNPEHREFNEVWYSYATSQGVYFRTDRILLRWANNACKSGNRALRSPVYSWFAIGSIFNSGASGCRSWQGILYCWRPGRSPFRVGRDLLTSAFMSCCPMPRQAY